MKRGHILAHGAILCLAAAAVGAAWSAGRITFAAPAWLAACLLLPLLTLLALRTRAGLPPATNAVSATLRGILVLMLVFALAEPGLVRRNDELCVLFLLDRSDSVPEELFARQLAYVNGAAEHKRGKDTAGVVVFGEEPSLEIMPEPRLRVERVYSNVGRQYTDLAAAVELAVAALPENARRKIVLVSDGNQNKGDLLQAVTFASANGVVADVLPVTYDYGREVLVEKVHLPERIKENETFDLRVHILSLQACPAQLAVYRNGRAVAREDLALKNGRNTYVVSLKIEEPGFYAFTARLDAQQDTIPDNNQASGYVYIQGASKILMVAPDEREIASLAAACREDGLETETIVPDEYPEGLGHLQNYDCVVLANVPADAFTAEQMEMTRAAVRDLGIGLVMLGGENSFGAGDYDGTPIEEALPVTMDIRQKKINPKGALVLILHTCEFADGNYWAKQVSKKAIETVNRQDDVGVLLYSGGEKWLFELRPAADKTFMMGRIDQAVPGDMPSFAPTVKMAYDALAQSDAMVRHMIIISDGDPSRPSPELVKKVAAAGITISTVAINPHSPRDVDVMKYLAYQTGGRYYFAGDPSVLPRIFVKEAKVVKRSLIFNQDFQPVLSLAGEITKGIAADELPRLGAYVATTAKPTAMVHMVSDNDNRDPILATWRYGLGKAVAFASDATVNWGKAWVAWTKYRKMWTQVIRWAARRREQSNLRLFTELDGHRGRLVIDAVDRQGRFLNFLQLHGRFVPPDNRGTALDVRQTAPGRYEAGFDARQVGVSIVNVGYLNPETGAQGFAATGISIPYSPEYRELDSNLPLLRQAAAIGGGRLLSGDPRADRVFDSPMPPTTSVRPAWEWLLPVAILLFLADVVLRRVIVTRDDLRAGLARARAAFTRTPAASRDQTMQALLRRKQQTILRRDGADRAPPAEFKDSLDRDAARSDGGEIEVAGVVETPAAGRDAQAPPAETGAGSTPSDEDAYTARLLAAKKRARSKEENRE